MVPDDEHFEVFPLKLTSNKINTSLYIWSYKKEYGRQKINWEIICNTYNQKNISFCNV